MNKQWPLHLVFLRTDLELWLFACGSHQREEETFDLSFGGKKEGENLLLVPKDDPGAMWLSEPYYHFQ